VNGRDPKASSRRPTLKTIADLCGLGVPSVSRALNDSPEIAEETKRRVRQIAEEVGYVPDRAGVRLRTGQTFTISLVFRITPDDQMSRLIPSIARALLSTRFQIAIMPALSHEDGLRAIRQVVEGRMADAVIFNETLIDDPRVSYLLEAGFPFATHGRSNLSHRHPYYDFDNGDFARKAAQLLQRRGRKGLTLFGPPHDRYYGLDTFLRATEAAADLGLRFEEMKDGQISSSLAELQNAARRYVARQPSGDGFVCSSDSAALAITSAMTESGRVIGRDFDVIVKGSRRLLGMANPGITVIEEDAQRGADFLARAVLQAIQQPSLPPMQEVELPDFTGLL
jgi:LacI family transcriptional regulator